MHFSLISHSFWIWYCLCIRGGGLHETETLGIVPVLLSPRIFKLERDSLKLSAIFYVTFLKWSKFALSNTKILLSPFF